MTVSRANKFNLKIFTWRENNNLQCSESLSGHSKYRKQ